MFEQRTLRVWGYSLAGGLVAFIVWIVGVRLVWGPGASVLGHDGRIVATTLAAAASMACLAASARFAFRQMDEFYQQGSRVAWYWGGIVGLLVSVPIAIFVEFGGLTLLAPYASAIHVTSHLTPEEGRARVAIFRMDYLLPVLAQGIGFAIVAAWWRLSKR